MRVLFAVMAIVVCASVQALAQDDRVRALLQDAPLPIEIKCPSGTDGILEANSVSKMDGTRFRWRTTYKNNDIITVWTGTSKNGGAPTQDDYFDLRTETDPYRLRYSGILVKQSKWLLLNVCLGSGEEREKFLAKLKANKKELGIQ